MADAASCMSPLVRADTEVGDQSPTSSIVFDAKTSILTLEAIETCQMFHEPEEFTSIQVWRRPLWSLEKNVTSTQSIREELDLNHALIASARLEYSWWALRTVGKRELAVHRALSARDPSSFALASVRSGSSAVRGYCLRSCLLFDCSAFSSLTFYSIFNSSFFPICVALWPQLLWSWVRCR